MPRMDGIEVMQEINKDERLKHLVIVVLTSSNADEDVLRSYKLRCNSYLVKPINFEAFAKMIRVARRLLVHARHATAEVTRFT